MIENCNLCVSVLNKLFKTEYYINSVSKDGYHQ